jgi:hypothetical protein
MGELITDALARPFLSPLKLGWFEGRTRAIVRMRLFWRPRFWRLRDASSSTTRRKLGPLSGFEMRSVGEALFGRIYAAPGNARALRMVAAGVLGVSLLTAPSPSTVGVAEAVASDDRDTKALTRQSGGQRVVVFRGDHYDARQFLRTFFTELVAPGSPDSIFDLDLDVNAAIVQGFNGEAARDATLSFSKKDREVLEFLFVGKIGQGVFKAELRRGPESRRDIYLETDDAGAFLRFINIYHHGEKGRARITMGLPTTGGPSYDGVVDLRDFTICHEPVLRPLATKQQSRRNSVDVFHLSHIHLPFRLSLDQATITKGIAVGPLFGATITGKIDLNRDEVKLRGAMVPFFYSDPDIFGRDYLDPQEGLISLSYEIEGRAKAPFMRLDLFGPFAPGLLRELLTPEEKQQ